MIVICAHSCGSNTINCEASVQGGRAAHFGGKAGVGSGEGPSQGQAPRHKIKIFNHHTDQELDVEVPEDRFEASRLISREHCLWLLFV